MQGASRGGAVTPTPRFELVPYVPWRLDPSVHLPGALPRGPSAVRSTASTPNWVLRAQLNERMLAHQVPAIVPLVARPDLAQAAPPFKAALGARVPQVPATRPPPVTGLTLPHIIPQVLRVQETVTGQLDGPRNVDGPTPRAHAAAGSGHILHARHVARAAQEPRPPALAGTIVKRQRKPKGPKMSSVGKPKVKDPVRAAIELAHRKTKGAPRFFSSDRERAASRVQEEVDALVPLLPTQIVESMLGVP